MSTPDTTVATVENARVSDLMKVTAARLFFERGLTKQEIGERLNISRFKAARLVEQAVADGLVRIDIRDIVGFRSDLGLALQDQFGLMHAIVATVPTGAGPRDRAAAAAAAYLGDVMHDGCKLGVGWGTTLNAVAGCLGSREFSGVDVVQLVGGFREMALSVNAIDICRRIAEAFGGETHLLHAPAILGSVEARELLAREAGVRVILDMHRALDIALVGIGAISPLGASALVATSAASEQELSALQASGVVGDIFGHFFTADGKFEDGPLGGRMIAIDPGDLPRIPLRIGVASGEAKSAAIRAAMAGQLINVLVTDEITALSIARG